MPADVELTVLDCTLRDGGYYTNWQFERGVVERYLRAVDEAGVDVVEVGFRSLPRNEFRGPFAHTTDDLLETLPLPKAGRVGVMSDTSDLVDHPDGGEAAVALLYGPADGSPVSTVRLASHVKHVEALGPITRALADLGYEVVVNLMQVSRYEVDVLAAAASTLAGHGSLATLYFADSLGDMDPPDVERVAAALRQGWDGPLGFHAHDNRRMALANTRAAIELGCTWVDATIRGMGRGAGNAQTEFLLADLARRAPDRYRTHPLVQTVAVDFADLQREHGWGADLLYLEAAERGVHPTYVQMLQSDPRYDLPDIVNALAALGEVGAHSFSPAQLEAAVESGEQHPDGTWDPAGWLEGRDVVLLASAPGATAHADAIVELVRRHDLPVLCLNTKAPIPAGDITAFVACHPTRISLEAARLAELGRPLVAPRSLLDRIGVSTDGEVLDYGVSVEPGGFAVGERSCTIPSRLAAAYGLAIAHRAGARRVLLAGFDGYAPGDGRQEQMLDVIRRFQALPGAPALLAITPTSYPVDQGSVYAPLV